MLKSSATVRGSAYGCTEGTKRQVDINQILINALTLTVHISAKQIQTSFFLINVLVLKSVYKYLILTQNADILLYQAVMIKINTLFRKKT